MVRSVLEVARYSRVHSKYSDLITRDAAVALQARCIMAGVFLSL